MSFPRRWFKVAAGACLFLLANVGAAAPLSPLGESPDWGRLDEFQGTVTADDTLSLLSRVYARPTRWTGWVEVINESGVSLRFKETTTGPWHELITPSNSADLKPPPRYWRPRAELPALMDGGKPLAGIKIALDPGHLGAGWAKMEERWFTIGDAPPVMEGEMTLLVAKLLADKLRALGATVFLTRETGEPATDKRPADFTEIARTTLLARGVKNPPVTYRDSFDPERLNSLQWESEHLFFRADIKARARRVNTEFRPDLALCLHFNAEAWGDPKAPTLVDKNHFHILVNGCYSPEELAEDDTRFQMLIKLLNGSHAEELAAANAVATTVAAATGLPPYEYTRPNAARVGPNPYVWARNLLANRLFECPVIYLEPYVMNSPDVFARVQAGDYEGERMVNHTRRRSIFREYADSVAAGLVEHFHQR